MTHTLFSLKIFISLIRTDFYEEQFYWETLFFLVLRPQYLYMQFYHLKCSTIYECKGATFDKFIFILKNWTSIHEVEIYNTLTSMHMHNEMHKIHIYFNCSVRPWSVRQCIIGFISNYNKNQFQIFYFSANFDYYFSTDWCWKYNPRKYRIDPEKSF